MKRFLPLIACALLAASGNAPAQMVVNGSFESGVNPDTTTTLFAVDSRTIEGWIVLNGTVDYLENRWTVAHGNRCVDMTGVSAGTLVQTISGFTPGRTYRLSFQMAANPEGGDMTKLLRVSIGSASQIFTCDRAGRSATNMGWSLRGLDFTATNSALTLEFAGLEDGLFGVALDSVSIEDPLFALSIRCAQVEVCWPSLTNRTYQVQYRSALTTNLWTNLGLPIPGDGNQNCILDSVALAEAQRYYQVIRLER